MAFQFLKQNGWSGLFNSRDARDIGNGLSKAQNISLDVGGKIRTIGGLADFTKVDGATALTQTAKICPGSSLFTYGSDHWRGTDTVVDLLADNNCTADQLTEADATTGWTKDAGAQNLTSETPGDEGISSNGTTYILKSFYAVGEHGFKQSFTTVIGQRYIFSADFYAAVDPILQVYIGSTDGDSDLLNKALSVGAGGVWVNSKHEFVAETTTTYLRIFTNSGNNKTFYGDDISISSGPRRDLDTNWLALTDVANAQIDLYNANDDSFIAALLDFGTISTYSPGAGKIDFPTTNTFTDSNSSLLNNNQKAGDIVSISGCSTTTANNITVVLTHVAAGTATVRGTPLTVQASEAGTVVLTTHNPTAFHYVNEALRASPANGGIALRPKHYSFANRIHFEGAGASKSEFANWFLNDVGPVAPTDVEATTANGDGAATNLTAGAGFEIGITRTADDGDWIAGTYIIACAFRYDDGQVSALFVPSTDEEFGTAILDSDSLTLTVRAKNDYDERISGGYIFCRKDESDDAWRLLAEISMAEGARATLLGTYNAWNESSTVDVAYTANFKSLHPNVDSYESISGIDPTTKVETFSGDNAFWNASVIGGNRCFIFAPRYTDAGGNLQQFRDRVMYSQVNAYDTFAVDNIIDVVRGDAEDYVMGGIYGNDLLCFKSRTLYIIDISDPDPAGWQMKQDANKGKYPHRGIKHPGAYFETPHGPAWCNEFGVFLYNGNEIVPLLGDKIELSEHPLAYQRYMEFATDDYIIKTNDANLNFGAATDFSLEVIFKSGTTGSIQRLGMKGDATGLWYAIGINATEKLFSFIDDGTDFQAPTGTTTVTDDEWHHGVATFDRDSATGGKIYIDGTKEGTDKNLTAVGDIDDAGQPFTAGITANDLSSSPLNGEIALLRVWNGELSSTDITNLKNGAPASSISGKTLVLEWHPKSISDATWTDTGANSLDGTVVGATAIYEDSWASFWTNYSILGYHARTNQLVVNRDCTGKWSSGQDYGDCMIIDLDTGAITTGRRIFTKGIAYSNFCTDWNQDLIIAEQTSSTSVTIKRWTDEPQSQAAGLIDIRTADIDFGNPMFAKIFDALAAYYKSSAAQTTPFSYALDGDDRQTAWTRITGNFTAEDFWEKLTLEPTPFEIDTIRFKLDNPTAAGTLELNDLVLRYSEEQEDID